MASSPESSMVNYVSALIGILPSIMLCLDCSVPEKIKLIKLPPGNCQKKNMMIGDITIRRTRPVIPKSFEIIRSSSFCLSAEDPLEISKSFTEIKKKDLTDDQKSVRSFS